MKLLDVVFDVLKAAGKPLARKELCNLVLATGKWTTKGKTPEATIAAAVYRDIELGGSRFVKDERGKFKLSCVTPKKVALKKKTQAENVIEALEKNGGFATFSELNQLVDTSTWKTKTPAASIRGIVQTYPKIFYKIMPGQWGLVSMKKEIEASGTTNKSPAYTHGYYQGLLVEIGNADNYKTYVPPQDKNRAYSHKTLKDIVGIDKIYNFTAEKLLSKARTVDTIWFNIREMPEYFFEVEHTTDMRNSLDKFLELQDFYAKFRIVSLSKNAEKFKSVIGESRYSPVLGRVKFYSYEDLVKLYNAKMVASKLAI